MFRQDGFFFCMLCVVYSVVQKKQNSEMRLKSVSVGFHVNACIHTVVEVTDELMRGAASVTCVCTM